jgi:hypothetical protein
VFNRLCSEYKYYNNVLNEMDKKVGRNTGNYYSKITTENG